MKKRGWVILVVMLLVGMGFLATGVWYFDRSFSAPNRIEAWYWGRRADSKAGDGEKMHLMGRTGDWYRWVYDDFLIDNPGDFDVSIQLGRQSPVKLRDLTPAMVEQFNKETGSQMKVTPSSESNVSPWVVIRDGVVVGAHFSHADRSIRFSGGKSWFELPVRQSEFEVNFGPPSRVETRRFGL
jgi:hypothetical protein